MTAGGATPRALTDAAIAAHSEAGGMVLICKGEDFVVLRLRDRFALIWLRWGNAINRALALWLESPRDELAALLMRGERYIEARRARRLP